jgi:hypothetical protein
MCVCMHLYMCKPPCNVVNEKNCICYSVVRGSYSTKAFMPGLRDSKQLRKGVLRVGVRMRSRTVSQICSLICLLSMVIMRILKSTPMVPMALGSKRLSTNCRSKPDFPTTTDTHVHTRTHTCTHTVNVCVFVDSDCVHAYTHNANERALST